MNRSNAKLFENMARMASTAASTFGGFAEQFKDEIKSRVDRVVADMDFVSREEFDALADMLKKSRREQELLKKRLAALEKGKKKK